MNVLALLNPRVKANYSRDFEGAVAVIAVPFNSYAVGDSPDGSNKKIAEIVREFARERELPVFVQREHATVLAESGLVVTEYKTVTGEWVQSHVLMRWIVSHVLPLGRKVILVGHPHHVRRCAILARHFGLRPVVPCACEDVPYDPRKRPGDQWWCRSPRVYILWEYATRIFIVGLWLLGRL